MILSGVWLGDEDVRGTKMLHPTSEPKLRATCEQKVVSDHREVMQSECPGFLAAGQNADLQRMYRLLRRVEDGLEPVRLYNKEAPVFSPGAAALQTPHTLIGLSG